VESEARESVRNSSNRMLIVADADADANLDAEADA
jgi:hypothetical protein